AGEPVTVTDLSAGLADLPPTDAVRLEGPTVRVVVRPSGTEPKLKAYLQARVPLEATLGLTDDRERAGAMLVRLRQEISAVLGLG
ncbi:MAG TPA: phospho-sugar mutase, partial [Friedmanniella sp.]